MGLQYRAISWNRQKKIYDFLLGSTVSLYLLIFVAAGKWAYPDITDEILLMRATGSAGFILLHLILMIGPLARLEPRFLPLLYNRRHMGVTLFLLALIHAAVAIGFYHAAGSVNPLVGIFTSSPYDTSLAQLPFQPFGFLSLCILFLMAATSHDFWLHQLSAPTWKALHMLVYVAYASLVIHVVFGVLQAEKHLGYVVLTSTGAALLAGLHLGAAWRSRSLDRALPEENRDWIDVGSIHEIPDNRAKIATIAGERIAIFRYHNQLSAVSNVCQHQNGPLGEGRIIDGCITCPWHGYQYRPEDGASPPPFNEKIPTFSLRLEGERILVHPHPHPAGTRVEPVSLPLSELISPAT